MILWLLVSTGKLSVLLLQRLKFTKDNFVIRQGPMDIFGRSCTSIVINRQTYTDVVNLHENENKNETANVCAWGRCRENGVRVLFPYDRVLLPNFECCFLAD